MNKNIGAIPLMLTIIACAPAATEVQPPASQTTLPRHEQVKNLPSTHHTPQPRLSTPHIDTSPLLSGVVIESLDSDKSAYIMVEREGERTWIGGPLCEVKKNETIKYPEGMPFRNYESKSLNRKFEVVYFVNTIVTESRTCNYPGIARPQVETHDEAALRELGEAESRMKVAFDALIANKARGNGEAVKRLAAAQEAWTRYRDAQLDALWPNTERAHEGSNHALCVLRMKTALTLGRDKELRFMLSPPEGEECPPSWPD